MAESGSAPPGGGTKPLAMTNLVVVKATPSADISTDKTMAAGSETAESAKATQRDNPRIAALEVAETLPRVGRYVLLRKLGEGGMGVVYAAYDQELDRKVALKIIHPERQQDPELRARVIREAQALARVSAPNVIHVYQVGEVEGQLFIAMEFVNGTTLSKWQSDPAHKWQDILRMYIAAGQGLQSAHEAGLVHRDFKPETICRVADGALTFRFARQKNGERTRSNRTEKSHNRVRTAGTENSVKQPRCEPAVGAWKQPARRNRRFERLLLLRQSHARKRPNLDPP